MKTDFNHRVALWQLFFARASVLQGFLYSALFYVLHFYRRYHFQPLENYSIYNHPRYEFILFLLLGYLLQLILLKAKIYKYGYSIEDTFISIFDGKLDFNWNISKSEETRFFYKNVKQAVVKESLFDSYVLEIQPSGLSITPALKIRSIKGTIYGLSKTQADNLAAAINEKIGTVHLPI